MTIDHEEIGRKIGALVAEKNANYGDSFRNSGEIMKFLFPNGIPPEKYKISLALVRILDKIFRIATNPGYNNEDPWRDIAGYCILMAGYESKDNEINGTPASQVLKRIDEEPLIVSGYLPPVDTWRTYGTTDYIVTEYKDGTTETLYPDGRKVVTKAEITDNSPLGRIRESRELPNSIDVFDSQPALRDAGIA